MSTELKAEWLELTGDDTGERIDIFLSEKLSVTRSYAQKLIKSGGVLLNNNNKNNNNKNIEKPSYKIKSGEIYNIKLDYGEDFDIEPEPVDFGVIYEDKDIAVINKPAGLVTHPAPGNWHGTLVHGLLYRYPDIKLLQNKLRPGIVHRLDAVTSGLMVAARSQKAYDVLTKMFQEREITKKYLALVHGVPERRDGILSGAIGRDPDNPLKMAVIDVNDGGRPALTGYKVLTIFSSSKLRLTDELKQGLNKKNYSLIMCSLFTGRTHQIRVHMAALGHVIYGDTLYGAPDSDLKLFLDLNLNRIFLHSWRLEFKHPMSGELMRFCQPLPDELRSCLHEKINK